MQPCPKPDTNFQFSTSHSNLVLLLLMLLQQFFGGQHHVTLCTPVLLFVRFDVLFESLFIYGGIPAPPAVQPEVSQQVALEVAGGAESQGALPALERLLPCVDPHVELQVPVVGCAIATLLTPVCLDRQLLVLVEVARRGGSLAWVQSQVPLQRQPFVGRVVTAHALEMLHVQMCESVPFQVTGSTERFLANGAAVGLLTCVSSDVELQVA